MQDAKESEFSFKGLFFPLTTLKAIHIIIFIGIIVFSNSLFNDFVYDDIGQIVSNPLITSTKYIPYYFSGSTFFDNASNQQYGTFYRPLALTVYSILFSLFGPLPFAFHFFQLFLHILNSILIFLLFKKFLKIPLSFFLSLIFLVHPINQEAVAYISDLQDVLFLFFGLIALLISSSKKINITKIALINILLLLSLFSKETAILFVPIILLNIFIWHKKTFSNLLISTIISSSLLFLAYRFLVIKLAEISNPTHPITTSPLIDRVTTIPSIMFYYLKTFIFPNQLALGYSWVVTNLNFNNFYLPLIIDILFIAIILLLGFNIHQKNKALFSTYIFFVFWLLIGFIIHFQIIPLDNTVADRWFYFPFIGMLGIIGVIFSTSWFKKIGVKPLIFLSIIIVVMLSWRTIVRNSNWINMLELCQHDIQIVPESYVVLSVCGGELLADGQYEKSKKLYKKAYEILPNFARSSYEYGLSLEYTNEINKAREFYKKSIKMDKVPKAYVSLSLTYLKYDNNSKMAKKIIEEGLKTYPNYQTLQLFLAISEYRLNNKDKALDIAINTYNMHKSAVSEYVITQIYNNETIDLNQIISL